MARALDKSSEYVALSALRVLSVQQVERANSGHPGMPLGAADAAYVLWTRHLRYNPADPEWIARDRFVLSAGHSSALYYSLLHLAGYDLSIEDLKQFRQLHSKTPGHPERSPLKGIEVTTGPLGQGFANSVGIALGLKILNQRFHSQDFPGLPATVWALASDGDIMEGISNEAGSLAGHLGLDNLIVIYDSNRVTIEGSTDLAFSENVEKRFEALGWRCFEVNGHDHGALDNVMKNALDVDDRPSLIISHSVMGKHVSGHEGDHRLHGAPIGSENMKSLLSNLNWPMADDFSIPREAYRPFQERVNTNKDEYEKWIKQFNVWKRNNPSQSASWRLMFEKTLPDDMVSILEHAVGNDSAATRTHSGIALNAAASFAPWLIGGSADLAASNKAHISSASSIGRGDYVGSNIFFGVREHAMAAIANGLATVGAFKPFVATFLVFSDYMRPSIRLAALMKLPVIYLFTHDSIYVGEDGPTHQPVEHLAALRAIPGLTVFRPASGPEVACAWAWALRNTNGPTVLALTRQKVPVLDFSSSEITIDVDRGAYILRDSADKRLIFVATGSEVPLAVQTAELLETQGIRSRVISMPCVELFLSQSSSYRRKILPDDLPIVALEAGISLGWSRIVKENGLFIGLDGFGSSAPAHILGESRGFTPESARDRIMTWLEARNM